MSTELVIYLLHVHCFFLCNTFRLRSRRADFSEAVALSLSRCSDKLSLWG